MVRLPPLGEAIQTLVYLYFIHDWAVQVHGRDVEQHAQDADFHGLHLLVDPDNASLDIVAVHGMDGHWRDSWYHQEAGVFWLRDLLPDILPQARIYSYSYDSRTSIMEIPLTLRIYEHAQSLVLHLELERESTHTQRRPIIFLCHSLGGIVVKSALHYSDQASPGHLERKKSIRLSTDTVIFIDTPHQGGEGISLAQVISRALALAPGVYTNRQMPDALERYSSWLQTLQDQFNSISSDVRIICYYEQLETRTPIGQLLVVPRHSAVLQGALNMNSEGLLADHSTMTKYVGTHDPNFHKVTERLLVLATESEDRVRQSWERWDAVRDSISQQPSGILGTAKQPRVLREFKLGISWAHKQNPHFFTGRDDVLESVKSVLQESATHHNPKSVVLTGVSGVGKTEIAIEYAYRHQETYASTFWVDGSSESAAVSSITSILKTIQAHYEHYGLHIGNRRYELIAKPVLESSPSLERRKDCDITPIKALLLWLSLRANRSWLLIVDNVDDLESWDYGSVLPQTHWGAIIITSRRSDLALYRDTIQVDKMDEPTAISLLSITSRLKLIEESAEIFSARELVNRLGYLPLAIVQAASYIFQHHITVADFLLLFSSHSQNILSASRPITPWEEKTHAVSATWDISFQGIIAFDPTAARILMVCAYLSPHDISSLLLQDGMGLSRIRFLESVALLSSYSVVDSLAAGSADGSIALHPSVQWWAKHHLESRTQSELTREALVMLHKVYFLYGHEFEEWMRWTLRLGPHVVRLMYLYRDEVSQCRALPEDLISAESWILEQGTFTTLWSWMMWARGKMTEARNYVAHQISRIKQTETRLPPWQLLHHLRHMVGDGDRLNLLAWVVCEAQRLHSSSHPVVLDLLGDYADALQNNIQHDAAYTCYKWLLEARTNVLGLNHPGTSAAMLGLGRASSDCSERTGLLTAAASLRVKNLGREDPRTRDAIYELSKALCGCRQCLAVGVCTGGYEASTLVLEWLFPEYHGRPPWESSPGTFKEALDRVFHISEKEALGAFTHCDGLLLADLTRQLANNGSGDVGWTLMRPFFEFTTTGRCCEPDTFAEVWLTAWDVGADVAISWIVKNMEGISHSPTLLRQVIATVEESYTNGLEVPFWTQGGSPCLLSRYSLILWLLYVAEGDKATANFWLDTAISGGPGSNFADPWALAGNCVNHDEFDGRPPACGNPPSGTNMPPQFHHAVALKRPLLLVFADLLGSLFNSLPGRSSRHDTFVQGVGDPFKCDNCVGYALIDPVVTMKSMLETHAAGWLYLTASFWYGCQRGEFKGATLQVQRFLDLENFFGLRRDIWEGLRQFNSDAEDASTSCFSDIRLWQMCRA